MINRKLVLVSLIGLSATGTFSASQINSEVISSQATSQITSQVVGSEQLSQVTSKATLSTVESSSQSEVISTETNSSVIAPVTVTQAEVQSSAVSSQYVAVATQSSGSPIQEFYDNGRLKYEEYYSNGKLVEKKFYDEFGRIEASEDWRGGKRTTHFTYYPTGKLDTKTFYSDGKRTKYEDWANGKIQSQITYYSSGKIDTKSQYYQGKMTDFEDWYGGVKKLHIEYNRDGRVKFKTMYSNGKRSATEEWKDGRKLNHITYYTSGKVDTKTIYQKGKRVSFEDWYGGHRKTVIDYGTNGRVTMKTFYDSKGHRSRGEGWSNGRKTTTYEYYSNGKIKSKTKYRSNGKRQYKYTYRQKENKRAYKTPTHKKSNVYCPYYNNGFTSSYTEYYKNGKPFVKCAYQATNERVAKTRYNTKGESLLTEYLDFSKPDYTSRNYKTVVHKKTSRDKGYKKYSASTCSMKASRKPNAAVDIGVDTSFANRDYIGYTNKYGQLTKVEAAVIVRQSDRYEKTVSATNGVEDDTQRYCRDEAYVKGVKEGVYDSGHAIADSLGGAANAYNITPELRYNNTKGTQKKFEKQISKAIYNNRSVVTDYEMKMYYSNNKTYTPYKYHVQFRIDGKLYQYTFSNK